jgi:alpha-tubulin suppressor-like RCC1 family protein
MKRMIAIFSNLFLVLTLTFGSSGVVQSASSPAATLTFTFMPNVINRSLLSAAAVSAGSDYTCAITPAGGGMCWGLNASGQVGDGTYSTRFLAVNVNELASQVAALSTGRDHTCALMTTGDVKCWGYNTDGQLGDGTKKASNIPVDVVGLPGSVKAIGAGGSMTCAVLDTGHVMCWGSIGAISSVTPVEVGVGGTAKAISAGLGHVCVLLVTGGVKCWGTNGKGQVGNGTTDPQPTPVNATGLGSGVSAISAGFNHTCAVLTSGGAMCWGDNSFGQLGDGSNTERDVPTPVNGVTGTISQISAGKWFTCVLTSSGVSCWGNNTNGQLGDGTSTSRPNPAGVQGLPGAVTSISAGSTHACALASGMPLCWGNDASGQVGDNVYSFHTNPVPVAGLSDGMKEVRTGTSQTCALTGSGGVMCWGDNGNGQVGDNTTIQRVFPVNVFGLTGGFIQVSPGGSHSCALTLSGYVDCWGANDYGQLGSGSPGNQTTPIQVSGLTGGVLTISAGFTHTCALIYAGGDANTGGVKCWGNNAVGQLGDGAAEQTSNVPVEVTGLSSGVKAVSAGWDHTCALLVAGTVMCWGLNNNGQLGDGTTTIGYDPIYVKDPSGISNLSGVSAISGGASHTCALLASGGVDCWGLNSDGQLGDGTTSIRLTAVAVSSISTASAISAGFAQTCAVLTGGGVQCWGANDAGQLGNSTTTSSSTPVDVANLMNGAKVSTGRSHTCALTNTNIALCWGSNVSGQLGIGVSVNRYTPVEVVRQ